jgi:hypothetical protein
MSQHSDSDSTTNTDTTEGSDLGHDWYYSHHQQYEELFSGMDILRNMVEAAGESQTDEDSHEDLDVAFMWRSSHVVKTIALIRLRMDQEHRILYHGSYKDSDKTEFLMRDDFGRVVRCPAITSCRAAAESHDAHKPTDKSEALERDGLGRVDRRPERVATPARSDEVKSIAGLQATLRGMAHHFTYPRLLSAVYKTCIVCLAVLFLTCFGDQSTNVMWATIMLAMHYLA